MLFRSIEPHRTCVEPPTAVMPLSVFSDSSRGQVGGSAEGSKSLGAETSAVTPMEYDMDKKSGRG